MFSEARTEIQKYFRWFFGSNENLKICFRDQLTFSKAPEYLHELELLGSNSKELSDLIKP